MTESGEGEMGVAGGELSGGSMARKAEEVTDVQLFANSRHHWSKLEHRER